MGEEKSSHCLYALIGDCTYVPLASVWAETEITSEDAGYDFPMIRPEQEYHFTASIPKKAFKAIWKLRFPKKLKRKRARLKRRERRRKWQKRSR